MNLLLHHIMRNVLNFGIQIIIQMFQLLIKLHVLGKIKICVY